MSLLALRMMPPPLLARPAADSHGCSTRRQQHRKQVRCAAVRGAGGTCASPTPAVEVCGEPLPLDYPAKY